MNYPYQQQPQYPMYKQPQVQYPWNNQQPSLIRPVSSIEEVKASPIDFDGSVFYFPDIANKRIYTKAINMDGTVAINMYELKEIPTQTNQPIDSSIYVTRQEFEDTINKLISSYQENQQTNEQKAFKF